MAATGANSNDNDDRVRAILTAREAKGQESFARHLAYKTTLSAAQAIAALAVNAGAGQAADDVWSDIIEKRNAQISGDRARPGAPDAIAGRVEPRSSRSGSAVDWSVIAADLNARHGVTKP